jgi:hypothetical protein
VDWQLILVITIVGAAAVYLARSTWRSWRASKSGCGGGCGCATKAADKPGLNGKTTLISSEQLTARLRDPDRG